MGICELAARHVVFVAVAVQHTITGCSAITRAVRRIENLWAAANHRKAQRRRVNVALNLMKYVQVGLRQGWDTALANIAYSVADRAHSDEPDLISAVYLSVRFALGA